MLRCVGLQSSHLLYFQLLFLAVVHLTISFSDILPFKSPGEGASNDSIVKTASPILPLGIQLLSSVRDSEGSADKKTNTAASASQKSDTLLAGVTDDLGDGPDFRNSTSSFATNSEKPNGKPQGGESKEDKRNADSGFPDADIPSNDPEEKEKVVGELPPMIRGDTNPIETSETLEYWRREEDGTSTPHGNNTIAMSSVAPPVVGASYATYGTMSWLDAFMYEHRGSLWILFNTFFMVIWILVGGLSLYRLLGLPWCSLYLSRTQYLVIHLLIFTAATFEFVQLIHLSYGSHEGLPLFLTLLLTHTPTPCLAISLIIMIYCIFVSARLPVVGRYSPPLIYVGILSAFVIVLSFVGDIIVGVSRNSAFLIICRVSLTVLCLACMFAYIFNYKKIISVALLLRREFRGELKSLPIPLSSSEESHHLKKVLLTWSRITLVSCISGVLMCVLSFCLSLFFTVSFVPLWAFWILHSSIFVSQMSVVISMTFGAAFTLTYSNRKNIFYKYFFPSFPSSSSSDGSFIKRGNFIYQRVSVVNGPTVSQIAPTTVVEREEQIPLRNNNIITELSTVPYRTKVNLKRSATFNCTAPYGFQGVLPPCSSNLYPVLSDHILAYPNSQFNPDLVAGTDINDIVNTDPYYKPLHLPNSFATTGRRKYPHYNYARRYPMRSFHNPDEFNNFNSISKNTNPHRRSLASSPVSLSVGDSGSVNVQGLAGTIETLEVRHPTPVPVSPPRIDDNFSTHRVFPRAIPLYNHSFSNADKVRVMKTEPPEKPARRIEPILVKSVIKDDVNALPKRNIAEIDMKNAQPSPFADSDICSQDIQSNAAVPQSYFQSISKSSSPITKTCELKENPLFRNSSPFNYGIHRNSSHPTNYSSTISPSLSPNNFTSKYHLRQNSPINSSRFTPTSSVDNECQSPTFSSEGTKEAESDETKETESSNVKEANNVSFISDISHNNLITPNDPLPAPLADNNIDTKSSLKTDCSTFPASNIKKGDFSSPGFEAPSLPGAKRQSLKRNHSTAGDLTPSHKKIAEQSSQAGQNGGAAPDANGLKYPWYGTWGGRRRSKKRNSISEDITSSSSGFNLRRLSASKSSLTSLYEKLKKPKKGIRSTASRDHDGEKDTEDELADEKKKEEEVTEEEEEFLPRLDEDIDLASEIFKSSTVLADFYSLKRSDLKKRKKEREIGNDEREKNEEEGNDSEYEDASSSLITSDNDKNDVTNSLNCIDHT